VSGVPTFEHARIERNLREEWKIELLRQPLTTAGAEDRRRLPAMRAFEVRHILDDAKHGDVDALEHAGATERIAGGHVLRRRDDHRAVHLRRLNQRQLRVAGPGRHVDDEVVERPPRHVTEELSDDLHDDRTTPDRRLIAIDEESDGDQFDAMPFERDDPLVFDERLAVHA